MSLTWVAIWRIRHFCYGPVLSIRTTCLLWGTQVGRPRLGCLISSVLRVILLHLHLSGSRGRRWGIRRPVEAFPFLPATYLHSCFSPSGPFRVCFRPSGVAMVWLDGIVSFSLWSSLIRYCCERFDWRNRYEPKSRWPWSSCWWPSSSRALLLLGLISSL